MPWFQKSLPPVAMLHLVSDKVDPLLSNWCISRRQFSLVLDYLEHSNVQTTHFVDIVQQKNQRNKKQIVLSFDDCARHLLDFAVPELIKRNMKAAFYMPTAYIGKSNVWDVSKGSEKIELMNANELKDLVSCGMEVGSHSHSHVELGILKDIAKLKTEITLSKEILEAIIGRDIYSFAYPFGSVPSNCKTLLKEAGYHFGLSIYQPYESAFALRRFGIYEKDTVASLRLKLSGRYKWMRSIYDLVKKN